MRKNGCVANMFSGIISIFVAIFLLFLAALFCLTTFIPELLSSLSLGFLSYFTGFLDELINVVINFANNFFDANGLTSVFVGVISGVMVILFIVYIIGGIRQVKISTLPLEYYKNKKKIITIYVFLELTFGIVLSLSTILNILDVSIFALVILFNSILKMITCIGMAHSIRKERKAKKPKVATESKTTQQIPALKPETKQENANSTLSIELSKLVTLKVQGVINEAEYQARRAELERRYNVNNTKFSG